MQKRYSSPPLIAPAEFTRETTQPGIFDSQLTFGVLVDGPALSQDAGPSASGD